MNTKHISLAVAGLASFAAAQAVDATDAVARQAAQTASSQAQEVAVRADSLSARTNVLVERIDATEGKLTGLEESFLETKAVVDGLKKLKVSGLIQVQGTFTTDTNIVSSSRPLQQSLFQVRRGRVKATYDAGNGSVFVTQYNINQVGITPQDIYVKYDESFLKTFSIQGGLQDIPFGYEVSYSSSVMETVERSRFERNAMFKDEKDVGFILAATPKVGFLDGLTIKAAALNGYGIADATFDPKSIVGRLALSKNFYDAGIGFDFGASYYQDTRTTFATPVKFKAAGKTTQDSIGTWYDIDGSGSFKKSDIRKDLDAQIIGVDGQLSVDVSFVPFLTGAKFLGELYTGTAIGNAAGNTRTAYGEVLYARDVLGWYATYVQNVGTWGQTVVRYDVYDPNTNVEGNEIGSKTVNGGVGNGSSKSDLKYDTWYFGLNLFLNGNTKLTVGYDWVKNETTKALETKIPATNFSKDVTDDVVTVRAQFAF